MRTREAREEQTVLIGTALGIFVVVLGLEALGLWLADAAFGIGPGNAVSVCAVVIAAGSAIVHLVRSAP